MKHRVGFIGYGHMGGGYHWQVANDRSDVCDDLKAVAVFDLRQSARDEAIERGLIAYDNVEDLLANDEIDVIVVATANNCHCEMTCKALRAGKHVVCEKPIAMSPAEFEEMSRVSKETGKLLFVHQNRRYDKDFMIIKHAYDTGKLGKLYSIESTFCGGTLMGWRAFEDHGGGILYDWGVHLIDQIVYLVGEPVKSVYADIRKEKNPEVDDRSTVIITFESGIKATVTVAASFLAPKPRWAVYAEKGVMWLNDMTACDCTFREATSSKWAEIPATAYTMSGYEERNQKLLQEDLHRISYPDDNYNPPQDWAQFLYRNIFDTIDGNAEMIVKHEEAMKVMKIIEAAFKSAETGKVIEF